jgi:K+/H+ antiporter YhaU regulatory subunit KhtT/(2Fe-2S) ferredoxin
MAKKNSEPIYMRVAMDVAGRIVKGELKEGQKISGRTTFAGEYSVSPETIRKSMGLLEEMNIVTVEHGTGIYVASSQKAEEFIEVYTIRASINELKEELMELLAQRDAIEKKMNQTVNSIVDYSSRFKNVEQVVVHDYHLAFDCEQFEKSIEELKIWENTGATVVGIRRDGRTILSPSPKDTIKLNDRLLYVGNPQSSIRLGEYMRQQMEDEK